MRNAECGMRNRERDAVRWLVGCALAVALACSASCARSLRNPFSSMGPPSPDLLATGSSLQQLTAAVNWNAQKVQSYQTHNASISIPGSMGIPTLKGNIAATRPGRVRLVASTAISGSEVDLGSNEELFWFWVKRNEPPAVYFARHSQAAGSAAQQLMPIEPQWLLDALGMAEFKATDQHKGPIPGRVEDTVEITSIIASSNGPLTKRTVLHATKALVLEQHLYDGGGKLLASSVARSHRYYPESGVSLPQEIEIRIPPAELAMTVDVGTVELNRLADNAAMWALPSIPGAPPVDLGAASPSMPGGGAPTLGAQINDANWAEPGQAMATPNMLGSIPAGPTPLAAAPLAVTSTASGGAVPQFVPPGGVAARTGESSASTALPGTQRLPTYGVGSPSLFTR